MEVAVRRSGRFYFIAATCVTALMGCQPAGVDSGAAIAALFSGAGAEWIDMSHAYDESTIFWPTAKSFELEIINAGIGDDGYYYAANNFCTAEHGGTHVDAPVHFSEGRYTTDEIPLDRLVGAAFVVDVSDAAEDDADYLVGVEDLQAWEADNGSIPDGAILLLRTGWGERWPDRASYLGTAMTGPNAVPLLHFPGLHPDAARWLVENRDIAAIGIDTPSIDYGQSTMYESHRILYSENIPGFENVAALDRLPITGAYVIALPMKIGGGSGGPLRMVGVIPTAGT